MKTNFKYIFRITFLVLFTCILGQTNFAQQTGVKSWGFNTYGQLGNESIALSNIPVDSFYSYKDITSIQGGGLHTLALRANGTVLAVGYNPYGQLGNGNNATTGCYCEITPLQVKNPQNTGELTNITAISAGGTHSLALSSDGRIYAWGNNSSGQLGNGNNTGSNLPVQVGSNIAGFDGQVIAIDAGFLHNLALTSDGRVWAWGFNNARQLGDGSNTFQNSPKPVLSASSGSQLSDVLQIGAGSFHSLVLKKDGTIWAWGSNSNKQIGNPDFEGFISSFPTQVKQNILGGAVQISAGAYHNLALRSDGTIWIWGRNFESELGNGTGGQEAITEPTQNLFLSNVIEIKSDNSYHNLVRTREGKIFAWGNNAEGESGNGSFLDYQNTPFELISLGMNISVIGTGVYTSYAAAPQFTTDTNNQIIRGENFSIFFTSINAAGQTLVSPINPTAIGLSIPSGYTVQENQPAFNFTTNAAANGNIIVCLRARNEFNESKFNELRILQSAGSNLVDKTISSDYQRQQICAQTHFLSSFIIAKGTPTNAPIVSVSGRVLINRGRVVPHAYVTMTDPDGNARTVQTNLFGSFKFDEVSGGRNYTFTISARGYSFVPQTITINQDLNDLIFTPQ